MKRSSRIVLGLNSGTSADGVDVVACEIHGRGVRMRVHVIGHVARRYPPMLRKRLLAAMAPAETRTEEICRLHAAVGMAFARTAMAAVKRFGLRRVDLIGSHGQTICHLPPRRRPASRRGETGSMQIGDAAMIASELHAPVVSQFRQADMAASGQGAPLVPWTDFVLFASRRRNRIIQNIGGIANLTWLPAGGSLDDVIAFDSGPGNMVIDALVAHFTKGRKRYDHNGRLARRGKVHIALLDDMLSHRYFDVSPPKSCGREEFGSAWTSVLLRRFKQRRIAPSDWIATAVQLTVDSIVSAYLAYLKSGRRRWLPIDEIILCGGGAKNKTLMERLAAAAANDDNGKTPRMTTTADHGIPPQAKEAVSFAMLAAAHVDHVPANLPRVTGASRAVVLGQVCEP